MSVILNSILTKPELQEADFHGVAQMKEPVGSLLVKMAEKQFNNSALEPRMGRHSFSPGCERCKTLTLGSEQINS